MLYYCCLLYLSTTFLSPLLVDTTSIYHNKEFVDTCKISWSGNVRQNKLEKTQEQCTSETNTQLRSWIIFLKLEVRFRIEWIFCYVSLNASSQNYSRLRLCYTKDVTKRSNGIKEITG